MKVLRLLKWLGLGLVGLILLLVLVFAGLAAYDHYFPGRTASDFANVQYTARDGTTLYAYQARPAGPGPHPAVLLLHEWWGLNEDIIAKAEALAAEGYVVLAPDAWRGVSTRTIPHALWLVSTAPEERVQSDLDTALTYLKNAQGVDPERIASLGFCFGGGQSLRLGLRHPELAAIILFYGQLITDPAALAPLRAGGPVLGIFAAEDFAIPPEQVRAFEQQLAQLEVEHQITIYPGVNHGFANGNGAITTPGPAMDAWQETLNFLREKVQEQAG